MNFELKPLERMILLCLRYEPGQTPGELLAATGAKTLSYLDRSLRLLTTAGRIQSVPSATDVRYYLADAPAFTDVPASIEMPDSAMYGYLGDRARSLNAPTGWAYAAMLAIQAATGDYAIDDRYPGDCRVISPSPIIPSLYVGLVGRTASGKSVTAKRSIQTLGAAESSRVIRHIIVKDEIGLAHLVRRGPLGVLLTQDEPEPFLYAVNSSRSSMANVLASFWNEGVASVAHRKAKYKITQHLSLLLCVRDERPTAFIRTATSTSSLYDRFIWVPEPETFYNFSFTSEIEKQATRLPRECYVSPAVYEYIQHANLPGHLGEIALRVAVISSSANCDSEVSAEATKAAIELCKWQASLRNGGAR
jgi:hypothetical protein